MRVVINFLLKIIAMLFIGVTVWCHMILALLLWDKRFMELKDGAEYIFKDPKH